MRLAKLLLNTLLLIVTFVFIMFAQFGVTSLIAVQAGDDAEKIYIATDKDEAAYFDAPGFLIEDLKAGYAQEEGYWVRSWFGGPEWWANSMKWADVALSKVVVTFKAVVMPVLDIADIRDQHIEGYQESWSEYSGWYYILDSDEYKTYAGIDTSLSDEQLALKAMNLSDPECEKYRDYLNSKADLFVMDEERWILDKDHKDEYQFIRLASHYNTPEMQKYYEKFINSDGQIKFSVVSMYVHFIIAFVLSVWFVSNNKFKVQRTEDGENTINGGYSVIPRRRRKKDK